MLTRNALSRRSLCAISMLLLVGLTCRGVDVIAAGTYLEILLSGSLIEALSGQDAIVSSQHRGERLSDARERIFANYPGLWAAKVPLKEVFDDLEYLLGSEVQLKQCTGLCSRVGFREFLGAKTPTEIYELLDVVLLVSEDGNVRLTLPKAFVETWGDGSVVHAPQQLAVLELNEPIQGANVVASVSLRAEERTSSAGDPHEGFPVAVGALRCREADGPTGAPVAFTGAPFSGTGLLAALMTAAGADVRHHALGADGTASWPVAFAGLDGGLPRVMLQVRDPLRVVRSYESGDDTFWLVSRDWHLAHGDGLGMVPVQAMADFMPPHWDFGRHSVRRPFVALAVWHRAASAALLAPQTECWWRMEDLVRDPGRVGAEVCARAALPSAGSCDAERWGELFQSVGVVNAHAHGHRVTEWTWDLLGFLAESDAEVDILRAAKQLCGDLGLPSCLS